MGLAVEAEVKPEALRLVSTGLLFMAQFGYLLAAVPFQVSENFTVERIFHRLVHVLERLVHLLDVVFDHVFVGLKGSGCPLRIHPAHLKRRATPPNTGQRKILRTFDNADLGKVLPGVNRIHLKLRKDDRGRDAPLACDEDFEDTPYPTCVNSILQLIHAHQHSADVRQPSPEHLEEVFTLPSSLLPTYEIDC